MKVRLTGRFWIVVAAMIALLAVFGTRAAYAVQTQELRQLEQELARSPKPASVSVAQTLTTQISEAEGKLAASQIWIAYTRKMLSAPIVNRDVYRQLFALAKKNGVRLVSTNATTPKDVVMDGLSYHVLAVDVIVESSDMSAILGFITDVNTSFSTSVMGSVEIVVPQLVDASKDKTLPHAAVKFEIYSYKGE